MRCKGIVNALQIVMKALWRRGEALRKLYDGAVKALRKRYEGSVKALRWHCEDAKY